MLYLMLFSALALGFYAQTTVSSQVSRNDSRGHEAQSATESGLRLMRYHMSALNVSDTLTPAKAAEELYMQLAGRLEGTPNLGDEVLGFSAAVAGPPAVPAQIRIPDVGYIKLPDGSGFQATLLNTSPNLTLKVVGQSADGRNKRAAQVQYQRKSKPYALIGINGITMGGTAYTDSYDASKGVYNAATARKFGSIATNGNITLNNTVNIRGDVLFGATSALNLAPAATITGTRSLVTSNFTFPSVALPKTSDYNIAAVNNTSGTNSYPGGTYIIGDLNMGGTATVNWTGPVKLYIKTSYNVKDAVVINTFNNLPANRQLFFLPTCKTATWAGSNRCVGELYAPDTDFIVSGTVEKMGRIIAKTINHTSSGGLHFDESAPAPLGLASYSPVPNTYLEVRP